MIGTVYDEGVLFANSHCDYALADVDPARFFSVLQTAAPSSQVAALSRW
jgi:hypothetical protein